MKKIDKYFIDGSFSDRYNFKVFNPTGRSDLSVRYLPPELLGSGSCSDQTLDTIKRKDSIVMDIRKLVWSSHTK